MSNSATKEYLLEIKKRYFLSSKREKAHILDEFCSVCNFNRKYAIRLIGKKETTLKSKRKGRPKKYYGQTLLDFLKHLWVVTNLACSKRLKAAIPLWLPYYHLHSNCQLAQKDLKLLEEISPRTIDRLLHRLKSRYKKFGLSTTKPGSLLKKQVPIKTNQWDESRPVLSRQIPLLIAALLLRDSLSTRWISLISLQDGLSKEPYGERGKEVSLMP